MIASSLITALFVCSGIFALLTIAHAWRRYGTQLKDMQGQLSALDDREEFFVRVAITETREFVPLTRRSVVRARKAPRPQPRHAARAAA